ncbi:MAG: 50S ribosomal protein L10 [Patescibacteria group bacterium]|jgi:large subunit ribosomal protein L10
MPTQQKIDQVKEVADKISESKSAALVQYQGLNAEDISALRDNIKQAGGRMEVIKNTLLMRALESLGIKLPEKLTGPTSITYCLDDEIAPLKEIDKVNKDKELTGFKYGIFENKLLSVEELTKFLILPSKSTLIAQFVGGLANPLTRLVYSLKYSHTRLALVLKAISEKQQ